MKVLAGPRVDLSKDTPATAAALALAGPDGELVSLLEVGVKNLSRQITQAEVALLRKALRCEDLVVGYVCMGAGAMQPHGAGTVVAVTDHVNLTWRSPLTGRNDDEVGPRFPSMTGIYAAPTVLERLGAGGGIIVERGVVAGVGDDQRLDAYEAEVARKLHYPAVSSELVPVAIVAAHMGLRLAAAVVTTVGRIPEETGSGRI
jgi:purine-nucleoside phosphorylase